MGSKRREFFSEANFSNKFIFQKKIFLLKSSIVDSKSICILWSFFHRNRRFSFHLHLKKTIENNEWLQNYILIIKYY